MSKFDPDNVQGSNQALSDIVAAFSLSSREKQDLFSRIKKSIKDSNVSLDVLDNFFLRGRPDSI